jgi:hypothetical protein
LPGGETWCGMPIDQQITLFGSILSAPVPSFVDKPRAAAYGTSRRADMPFAFGSSRGESN